MLLCYITDRRQLPGDETARRRRLLEKMAEAARCGVDFIQLREKDLSARQLERLAREAVQVVRDNVTRPPSAAKGATSAPRLPATRLLINSRSDVALAVGAHGVHLRSDDISTRDARGLFAQAGVLQPVIGVSCHTAAEVALAEEQGADFVLFAPVFEKSGRAGVGLEALRAACRRAPGGGKVGEPGAMPVLALGGVTLGNASSCLTAGAAGIAAIRLFQENDIGEVVRALRGG